VIVKDSPLESSAARRARRRAERLSRPAPQPDPAYRRLSLDEVREVVAALDRERQEAAYWRRVLDARSASVGSASSTLPGSGADLSSRLAAARPQAVLARMRAIDVRAVRDTAPFDLPDLADLWQRPLPEDDVGRRELLSELAAARSTVDRYEVEVRRRYDGARRELVARYCEDATAALGLLPPGPTAP